MIWDVPHHRGMGFPLSILRPVGVYSILSSLCRDMHLRPVDLMNRLAEANAADAPLVGMRDLSEGIGALLARLREAGLIVRCAGNGPGSHTRYDITRLGAGLVSSLGPLADWAMGDFGFVVAATRVRLGLPPLGGPVPEGLLRPRSATGMAVSLLSGVWSDTVMVYVDCAGDGGVGPLRLEEAVAAALEASSGESRVGRRLHRGTLYRTLHRLVAKGLLERRAEPSQVLYALSPHGRGLMDAWWRVAEDFGIPHDRELFEIMARTSGWFPDASGG
jgi:DNA-binding HxlR family transcriptional regulator